MSDLLKLLGYIALTVLAMSLVSVALEKAFDFIFGADPRD